MVSKSVKARISEAIRVSEDYPEALRPAILSYLLTSEATANGSMQDATEQESSLDKEIPVVGKQRQRTSTSPAASEPDGDGDWFSKLAQELEVSPDRLRNIYEMTDDGKPRVRVILQLDSVPKLQIGYTLLHLIAYEKAGKQAATSDELRQLVQGKKAYDTGNFTRNFKKTKKLRPYGIPGQGDTEWVLTAPGREDGKRLIKELCSAELA